MKVQENITEVTKEELFARKNNYEGLSSENKARVTATFQNIKDVENAMAQRIVNLSDFDCDGICSALIIKKIFPNCETVIGDRFKDGYGIPNVDLQFHDMVICTDIGSSDFEKLLTISEQTNIAPFVVDHHEKSESFKAYEGLNVSRVLNFTGDKNAPDYCGTGLALKLYECYYANMVANGYPEEALKKEANTVRVLGMIGTVADMVSVNNPYDENRQIIQDGFGILRDVFAGKAEIDETLQYFLEACGLDENVANITTKKIGFDIAPCINALGRLEENGGQKCFNILSTPLFTEDGKVRMSVIDGINYIKQTNELRKTRMDEIMHSPSIQKAVAEAKTNDDNVCVIVDRSIEQGLTGLVANKIKEQIDKPTIVLTEAKGKDGILVGSGRNMTGFPSLYEMAQSDLCIKAGGHEGAIGLSIDITNFDDYKKELVEKYKDIEVTVNKEYLKDWQSFTVEDYLKLEPFGTDFPVPTIRTEPMKIENKKNLPFKNPKPEWAMTTIKGENGKSIKFTDWSKGNEWNMGDCVRIVAQPSYSEYGKVGLDYLMVGTQSGDIKELNKSNVSLPKDNKASEKQATD